MSNKKIGPWEKKSSHIVYRNPWIQVEHSTVIQPDGAEGLYGVVHFTHWALGAVVVDDHNRCILVGQHRFPLDEYSWEIPEGGGVIGEDPLMSIQREVHEETGIIASEWLSLGKMHTSNSVCNETAFLYLARGLTLGTAHPEGTEQLALQWVPFSEALQMAIDGRITDSLSLAGIFRAAQVL